jgi:hypothetical protein
MLARVTKVARVSARFSKSLARRRFLHVVAPLDDLHAQDGHFGHRSVNLPRVAAAIGPDQFEPGEAPADLVEDQPGTVAVLDGGGVTTIRIGILRYRPGRGSCGLSPSCLRIPTMSPGHSEIMSLAVPT